MKDRLLSIFFHNHNGSLLKQAKLSFQAFQLRPFQNKLIRAFEFVFNTFYKHNLLVYQITISYIFSNGMQGKYNYYTSNKKLAYQQNLEVIPAKAVIYFTEFIFRICLHYEASLSVISRTNSKNECININKCWDNHSDRSSVNLYVV